MSRDPRGDRASKWKDRVILAGFVPDGDLVYLYRQAYAADLAVAPGRVRSARRRSDGVWHAGDSSRTGSLPEVVGEAGVYFDPTDAGSIAEAIRMLAESLDVAKSLARLALGPVGAVYLGSIRARAARRASTSSGARECGKVGRGAGPRRSPPPRPTVTPLTSCLAWPAADNLGGESSRDRAQAASGTDVASLLLGSALLS